MIMLAEDLDGPVLRRGHERTPGAAATADTARSGNTQLADCFGHGHGRDRGRRAVPGQERADAAAGPLASCNKEATGKNGDDRKELMKSCLADGKKRQQEVRKS